MKMNTNPTLKDVRKGFVSGLLWFVAGAVVALALSKYSATAAYLIGHQQAVNSSDQVCMAWWFDNSAARMREAKKWMCGKDLRKVKQ
jgi:hypothetical protein